MVEEDQVSSFNESGYFEGRCQLVSSDSLAKEADEQDEILASIPNGSEVSIGRVLLTVLQEAILDQASFIHVQATMGKSTRRGEFRIRHRIGGKLWEVNAFPLHVYAPFCARLKIISSINIAERRVPQFGRFLYEQSHIFYEMRLSSVPTQLGETFVINVLKIVGRGNYTEE